MAGGHIGQKAFFNQPQLYKLMAWTGYFILRGFKSSENDDGYFFSS